LSLAITGVDRAENSETASRHSPYFYVITRPVLVIHHPNQSSFRVRSGKHSASKFSKTYFLT